MMRWFVDESVVQRVMKTTQSILEDEVEVRPESLPDAVLDENVDVHLIRRFFTNEAWLVVMDAVEIKSCQPVHVCKTCFHDLHEKPSVVCDHCLSWYHIQCTGLKQKPKSWYWFCGRCHEFPLD